MNAAHENGVKDVFEIRKNSMEVIRTERCSFRGEDLCNIQVWREKEDGLVRCKGKSICFRWHLLEKLIALLQRLLEDEEGKAAQSA